MQREGLYREMKLRKHYEKPSLRKARERTESIRRFRKLQRKYRKQNLGKDFQKRYGTWSEDPDFLQKHERKNLVFDAIEKELDD